MSSRRVACATVAIAISVAGLAACGNDETTIAQEPTGVTADATGATGMPGTTGTSGMTGTTGGVTTIVGRLTVDGIPFPGEKVKLGPGTDGGVAPSRETSRTASDGGFVFEDIEPGSYSLSVAVLVEGATSTDSFGMSWDEPCRADGFEALNAAVSDQNTGLSIGVIVSVSNQANDTNDMVPIDLAEGELVTVNIALICS